MYFNIFTSFKFFKKILKGIYRWLLLIKIIKTMVKWCPYSVVIVFVSAREEEQGVGFYGLMGPFQLNYSVIL